MTTTEPRLDWREGRRRRAWELRQQGGKQRDIAAARGATCCAWPRDSRADPRRRSNAYALGERYVPGRIPYPGDGPAVDTGDGPQGHLHCVTPTSAFLPRAP